MQTCFFPADGRTCFFQWDLNREMIVTDESIKELHYCNGTSECSLVCKVEDGKAAVPNILLQTAGNIRIYGYTGNYTEVVKVFRVHPRTKPEDYVYTETEVKRYETLEQGLADVKQDLETAKTTIPAPYNLPTATISELGGVKVGGYMKIDNGVLNPRYTDMVCYNTSQFLTDAQKSTARNNIGAASKDDPLPVASSSVLGGVIVANGLNISPDGSLSVNFENASYNLTTNEQKVVRQNIGASKELDTQRILALLAGYMQGGVLESLQNYTSLTIKEFFNPCVVEVAGGAFYGVGSTFESVDLPNCKIVWCGGFSACTSLTRINLPKAEYLSSGVFANCPLETLVLPSAVTLASGALYALSNLKLIDIGKVCTLEGGALSINGLKTVILRSEDGVSTIKSGALSSSADFYIYVPSVLKAQYETTYSGQFFASKFRAIEDYPDICG